MQLVRPPFALSPHRFGRGPVRAEAAPKRATALLSNDIKLFAATFLAGFLFVSILIG
jgi:hypothetical protein